MIAVNVLGQKLRIVFYHRDDFKPVFDVDQRRDATSCLLYEEDGEFPAAVGQSIRHPDDPDDRIRGRKLALARALQIFTDNREVRRVVWEQFFAASPRHKQ